MQCILIKGFINKMLAGSLEISNGLCIIKQSDLPYIFRLSAIVFLDAFGGICTIMQTKCVCGQYISIKIHMSENDSMYCNTDNIDSDICIKINIINYSSSSDCESVSLEASVSADSSVLFSSIPLSSFLLLLTTERTFSRPERSESYFSLLSFIECSIIY